MSGSQPLEPSATFEDGGLAAPTTEPSVPESQPLRDWLQQVDGHALSASQAVIAMVPLLRQVAAVHEVGQVAPLEGVGAIRVEHGRLWFEQSAARPIRLESRAIQALERRVSPVLQVISEASTTEDATTGASSYKNLQVGRLEDDIKRPLYLPGYRSWEHQLGHHDALTDIFVLGLILASLSCGTDLHDHAEVVDFAETRHNLLILSSRVHPVIARLIVQMTELDRHRRAQDLSSLAAQLEGYRDVDVDLEFDVGQIEGFKERDRTGKRRAVLAHLEERLFEISRRNPLLHFKPRTNTLNLTLASVPLHIQMETLSDRDVLAWWPWLQEDVVAGKALPLGSYLRFREATYLPSTLNKIRLEAARDQREVGFSNLRLVIAFLRWHNLKEDPDRRLDSPLVLLPVKLIRKKGVRDQYVLEPLSSQAEINPVLRHHLALLYGLRLPETIDLELTDLKRFHELLKQQIQASEPAVKVELVDRPRVNLVHSQARRTLDLYNRRLRRRRRVRSYRDLDYSYNRDNFQPLGLRLYQTKVEPAVIGLERLVEAPQRQDRRMAPTPGEPVSTPSSGEPAVSNEAADQIRQRSFIGFVEGGETQAFHWELDLTALTLGNFRYRKMTLVRDYDELLEKDRDNAVFDALFSVAPKPETEPSSPLPIDQGYPILPADPTQSSAIGAARRGDSYIIQGPPGTGKSQTIANLIADFVARKKRVLFVCQKRAAIDVVYLRLKALGLDELSCLVHDAQLDKKSVIMDLRSTYERFMESGEASPGPRRDQRLGELREALAPLEEYDAAMRRVDAAHGISVHALLSRSLELGPPPEIPLPEIPLPEIPLPEIHSEERADLPRYGAWHQHAETLKQLDGALSKAVPDGIYAHHALAGLNPETARETRPEEGLRTDLTEAERLSTDLVAVLREQPIEPADWDRLHKVRDLVNLARQTEPLAKLKSLALIDRHSRESEILQRDLKALRQLREDLKKAQALNRFWRQKWPADELEIALGQATRTEGRLWAVLTPTYWRLRKVMQKAYDWSGHQVRPTTLQVLKRLDAEHKTQADMEKENQRAAERYGCEQADALEDFLEQVEALRNLYEDPNNLTARLCAGWLERSKRADALVIKLADAEPVLQTLSLLLVKRLASVDDLPVDQLPESLRAKLHSSHLLADFLPCLRQVDTLDPGLARALQSREWTLLQLESVLLQLSLEDLYAQGLPRLDRALRASRLQTLAAGVEDFRRSNVSFLLHQAQSDFRRQVALGQRAGSELDREEKEQKKRYNQGRRTLEHEFGKQMRYKSIRDLWSGPSGEVMRDLKPIWLMSPLSVSDTLSLDDGHFDVVIFDEASQIPVEEAVPALFRAPQAIVVGDQMQLPPTRFFASQNREDEVLWVEEEGEAVEFDLSSNSFLNQAAKQLPSTMLGWHYRSRSEALISFSNAAFYGGRLLVVPEERLPRADADPIRIPVTGKDLEQAKRQAEHGAERLLQRAVSSHFIENGLYENRRNTPEADYIAALVAALLRRDTGHSLGIVAFSEAQQGEIEQAMERLARRDAEFNRRYLAEQEREHDGEMVGLILKNLENIQGDERDIMLLSVCYGPNAQGRCRMSFGPINQAGGEKRLNVAFSRSKHHMAVITSMTCDRITNTYNDGANALRQYLRYAEAASVDDTESVKQVLRELLGPAQEEESATTNHPLVQCLAEAFEQHGYQVDRRVGQSLLRCDLAVYRPGDETYRLGILVDTAEHYEQTDIIERDLIKPRLLQDFGWHMATVWTQDWTLDREGVLRELLQRVEDPQENAN